jgi:hypothetical protein
MLRSSVIKTNPSLLLKNISGKDIYKDMAVTEIPFVNLVVQAGCLSFH